MKNKQSMGCTHVLYHGLKILTYAPAKAQGILGLNCDRRHSPSYYPTNLRVDAPTTYSVDRFLPPKGLGIKPIIFW